MQLPNPPKRPEATTVFVSLALGLLVLFTYLNASAIPSRKLLQRVVPPPQDRPGPRAVYPEALKKAVVMSLSKDEISDPYTLSESVVLLNTGVFSETAPTGKSYRDEVLEWMTERREQEKLNVGVTCFVGASATPMSGLTDDLARRRPECLKLLGLLAPKGFDYVSRSIPETLNIILQRRNLPVNSALLVTLTEYANAD